MVFRNSGKGNEKVELFEHSINCIPLLYQTVWYSNLLFSLSDLKKASPTLLEIKSVEIATDLT